MVKKEHCVHSHVGKTERKNTCPDVGFPFLLLLDGVAEKCKTFNLASALKQVQKNQFNLYFTVAVAWPSMSSESCFYGENQKLDCTPLDHFWPHPIFLGRLLLFMTLITRKKGNWSAFNNRKFI